MEILTYPIGLVVGVLPVLANLGGPGQAPARLLLDGRPTCEMTAEAPRCNVDLGADPRVHLLELVRTDSHGNVIDRAVRWVNRPGAETEVYLRGSWDTRGDCTVDVGWGHPRRLEPTAMTLTANGETVLRTVQHEYRFHAPGTEPPVVTVDLTFPDGRRASQTKVLGGGFVGRADAELEAVPIALDKGASPPATLSGFRVSAVEDAPVALAFVVEPGALRWIPRSLLVAVDARLRALDSSSRKAEGLSRKPSMGVNRLFAVVPSMGLQLLPSPFDRFYRWQSGLDATGPLLNYQPMRVADAVAVAGFRVASHPRRRAVVLVIVGDHSEKSRFTVAQARTYLSEIMVPLLVWRVHPGIMDEWPRGPSATDPKDLSMVDELARTLDAQRIAWVEGDVNPATLTLREGETGFTIAGRQPSPQPARAPATTQAKP